MPKKALEWNHAWKTMFAGALIMLAGMVWKYYGPETAVIATGAVIFAKGFLLNYSK